MAVAMTAAAQCSREPLGPMAESAFVAWSCEGDMLVSAEFAAGSHAASHRSHARAWVCVWRWEAGPAGRGRAGLLLIAIAGGTTSVARRAGLCELQSLSACTRGAARPLKFWSSPRTLVARVGRLNLALVHSSDTHTVCSLTLTAGAQRGYWGYYAKITATLVTSPIRREVPAGRSLCSLMLPRTEQEASPPAPPERETGEPLRRRNATEVLSSS